MKLKLRHQIPSLYAKLLPEELLDFVIRETQATCGDCAMTREKRGARAKVTYQADLKCCTFQPMLPNYLIGELLSAGPSPQLLEQLQTHGEALPLALLPSAEYRNRFNGREKADFGQRKDLLCGYYDPERQNCSIWRSRGSVCTTFFCMSDLGPQGMTFWRLLGDYLHHVEMCLSEEAMVHLDFSPRQVSEQLDVLVPNQTARRLPSASQKRLWNGYERKEFYLKSAKWVRGLTRDQMPEILGQMGLRKQKAVLAQIRKISREKSNVSS